MAEPVADDFAQIARNLAYIRQQRKEAQDRANAEEAAEANMQRADEPVPLLGDPGDEDDLGPWNYASYLGDVRL